MIITECGCQADAGRLIYCATHRAAPDLLAALKLYMRGHDCEGTNQCPGLMAAQAAIAKARGEVQS